MWRSSVCKYAGLRMEDTLHSYLVLRNAYGLAKDKRKVAE